MPTAGPAELYYNTCPVKSPMVSGSIEDDKPVDIIPTVVVHHTGINQKRCTPEFNSNRLSFTPYQLELLLAIFSKVRYPNSGQKNVIAKWIGITREQVKIWYQNRRRKDLLNSKTSAKNACRSSPEKLSQVPEHVINAVFFELEQNRDGDQPNSPNSARRQRKGRHGVNRNESDSKPNSKQISPSMVAPGKNLLVKTNIVKPKARKALPDNWYLNEGEQFSPLNQFAPYEYSREYLHNMRSYRYPLLVPFSPIPQFPPVNSIASRPPSGFLMEYPSSTAFHSTSMHGTSSGIRLSSCDRSLIAAANGLRSSPFYSTPMHRTYSATQSSPCGSSLLTSVTSASELPRGSLSVNCGVSSDEGTGGPNINMPQQTEFVDSTLHTKEQMDLRKIQFQDSIDRATSNPTQGTLSNTTVTSFTSNINTSDIQQSEHPVELHVDTAARKLWHTTIPQMPQLCDDPNASVYPSEPLHSPAMVTVTSPSRFISGMPTVPYTSVPWSDILPSFKATYSQALCH